MDCKAHEAFYLQSLAAAVAWCAPRADPDHPATCLRSDQLTPPDPQSGDIDKAIVRELCRKRSELLGPVAPFDADWPGQHAGGKLLVYECFKGFEDGASQFESEGYFDLHELPPWDTWVDLVVGDSAQFMSTYLLAWVPSAMIPFATAGIDVAFVNNIDFATDRHSLFLDHLRSQRLLP